MFFSAIDVNVSGEFFGDLPSNFGVETPNNLGKRDIVIEGVDEASQGFFTDAARLTDQVQFIDRFVVAECSENGSDAIRVEFVVAEVQNLDGLIGSDSAAEFMCRDAGQVAFGDGHVSHVRIRRKRFGDSNAEFIGFHLKERIVHKFDSGVIGRFGFEELDGMGRHAFSTDGRRISDWS